MTTFATATDEQIVIIPWAHLHDSKRQYRKHYPESYIQDLAANIKAVGRISSPMLVRPIVPALFAGTGDANAIAGYEVISGHCRKRAGTLAELPGGPCIVREMTDAQASLIMISENLQRRDVHPIEEAEGFADMIKEHGKTADDLAAEFGKSRSYIYGRLKLLQACPQVRKACLDDEIGSEVALLIARVGGSAIQTKALAAIAKARLNTEDGGASSFRSIRDLLRNEFTLELSEALFNPEDVSLVNGAGACSACPKRSGNAPEFEDYLQESEPYPGWKIKGNPNRCTDPECFGQKKKAELAVRADALIRTGELVITGSKAKAAIEALKKPKGAYVPLEDVQAALKKSNRKTLAGKTLDTCYVLLQNPHTGKTVKAIHVDTLKEAGVSNPHSGPQPGSQEHWKQEREKNEKKAKAKTEKNTALLKAVRAHVAGAEWGLYELQLLARHQLEVIWCGDDGDVLLSLYPGQTNRQLEVSIETMTMRQLTQLLLDCALSADVTIGTYSLSSKPGLLLAAAEHYGVQASASDEAGPTTTPTPTPSQPPTPQAARPFPTPSPAARAQEEAQAKAQPEKSPAAPAAKGAAAAPGQDQPKTAKQPGGPAAQKVKVDAGVAAGGCTAQASLLEQEPRT